MNRLIFNRNLAGIVCLLFSSLLIAQSSSKESFNVSDGATISVNASHTNVVFETWNKNKIEVEAYVDGDDLSAKEKEEIFNNWKFRVIGNSKEVIVTSNDGSLWGGVESMGSLKALDRLKGLESLNNLDALESLKSLKSLESLSGLSELGDMDWSGLVPNIPDFEKVPKWPFTNGRPSIMSGNGGISYNFDNDGVNNSFDRDKYRENKQAYVNKLNKKYDSNVTVRQTDAWLDDVDDWAQEFEGVMEDWGEDFGKQFEEKFGPEFERKMEKWGEEFGKDMEKWGEEFGEQFGKEMEKWGESFGEDMEKWGEEFGKDVEKWAEQFEDEDGDYTKTVTTDKNGNKVIKIKSGRKGDLFDDNVKAKKTIIIRMPKGTETDINVRYGKVKLADAVNVNATLNYSALTANSIDGGKTLINASYAPVLVNNWKRGELILDYVDDCRLNNVQKIMCEANSSNVNINKLNGSAVLSGSFGNLFVNTIDDNFKSLDISLENTDATLNIPDTAFTFYYNGKKSRFESPSSIEITTKNKNDSRSLLKGYHKSLNSNSSIVINASYSNVIIK